MNCLKKIKITTHKSLNLPRQIWSHKKKISLYNKNSSNTKISINIVSFNTKPNFSKYSINNRKKNLENCLVQIYSNLAEHKTSPLRNIKTELHKWKTSGSMPVSIVFLSHNVINKDVLKRRAKWGMQHSLGSLNRC